MRALVTGGAVGFGHELVKAIGTESKGLSRRTGHNLWKSSERKKIVDESLSYDTFVNFAHADFMQTQLLYEVGEAWEENNHSGYIINIGSYATYDPQNKFQSWVVSKKSLDIANQQFCRKIENGLVPFRMTLLKLAMLDTEKSRQKPWWPGQGHTPEEVAKFILWLADRPAEMHINEVTAHYVREFRGSAHNN